MQTRAFSEKTRKVVVTGIGMVTSIGNNSSQTWDNLIKRQSGIKDLSYESYGKDLPKNCKIGAPVRKDFEGKHFRTVGTDNLLTRMSISAAEEAIQASKLIINSQKLEYRTVILLKTKVLGNLFGLFTLFSRMHN